MCNPTIFVLSNTLMGIFITKKFEHLKCEMIRKPLTTKNKRIKIIKLHEV